MEETLDVMRSYLQECCIYTDIYSRLQQTAFIRGPNIFAEGLDLALEPYLLLLPYLPSALNPVSPMT